MNDRVSIKIYITSIVHRIKNPLRRTSVYIATIFFQTYSYSITNNSYGPKVNCIYSGMQISPAISLIIPPAIAKALLQL